MNAIIQPAIVEAALSPSERYEQWLTDSGVTGLPVLTADTDGDWQPDLVEYFAALDPIDDSSGVQAFTVDVGEDTVELIVRRRLDAGVRGLSYEIQEAGVLTGPWTAVTGLTPPEVTQSRADGVEIRRYQLARPDVRMRLYRLAVTVAP